MFISKLCNISCNLIVYNKDYLLVDTFYQTTNSLEFISALPPALLHQRGKLVQSTVCRNSMMVRLVRKSPRIFLTLARLAYLLLEFCTVNRVRWSVCLSCWAVRVWLAGRL